MEIRDHWKEWVKKYPGLKSGTHGPSLTREGRLCQEAHAEGWMGGAVAGRIAEHEVIQETMKAKPPMFLMQVGDEKKFMQIRQAGQVYNSDWEQVSIIGIVFESDGSVRDITGEERRKIRDIANDFSSSK